MPGSTTVCVAEVAKGIEIPVNESGDDFALTRATPRFVDAARELGLHFEYQNGSQGKRHMVEATGAGCGWVDYDRDGWIDFIAPQGGVPDAKIDRHQPIDCLFRNVSGQFHDVTVPSRLSEPNYGQGVTIGDYDSDGFEDIFITNVGRSTLWHNCGDGTLEEHRDWAVSRPDVWSTAAAWADLDLDGDLDLYVGNYCRFDPRNPVICKNPGGAIAQCQPRDVPAVPDEFFINLGDGTFREVSKEWGLIGPENRTLGILIADLTGDKWPDIYIANDASANFLFVRNADGIWEDWALRTGSALDSLGRGQGSMGVAASDFDRNGYLDLYVTNFEGEPNTLYANFGPQGFRDVTAEQNLVKPTLPWVGFGTVIEDFNQDGYDDVIIANGHIDDLGRERLLQMPSQLFGYDGKKWRDQVSTGGDYFSRKLIGRGVAEADFDRDGDIDVAVIHQSSPMALLKNVSDRGHWLAVELVGVASNRRGLGATVELRTGNSRIVRQMICGGSYCSSREPLLVFGLGSNADPCHLKIEWSGGCVQEMADVEIDQRVVIVENKSL